jgi:hypothetical protein
VGDGGKSLHVRAEQAGEDLGLRLAELGELLGHVGDRAVVLAELLAGALGSRRASRTGGGSVSVARERLGERLGPGPLGRLLDGRAVAGLELGDPLAGERGDGLAATLLLDEAQRAGGEVVVVLVEGVPPGGRDTEDPRRTATAPGARSSISPSARRASRWRRTAAAVRPSPSASTAAVVGPCSRRVRATLLRVRSIPTTSLAALPTPRRPRERSAADFTTQV